MAENQNTDKFEFYNLEVKPKVHTSLGMINDDRSTDEIVLEPISRTSPREPQKTRRELQKRTIRTAAPAQRLATAEARRAEEERRQRMKHVSLTDMKLPYVASKTATSHDYSDGARPVRKNKKPAKILSLFIPTHSDGMTEIIRKGIVIICIVVLIFSMGILIKSTSLERKASKENAGNYFVTKYVYSYDIYKNDHSGKEK